MLYALLATACIALAAVAWSLRSAPNPQVVVLQPTDASFDARAEAARAQVADARSQAPAPIVTNVPNAPQDVAKPDAAVHDAAPTATHAPAHAVSARTRREATPREPSAAALTGAFRRKQRAVEACYARAPGASPQSEILFRIDESGRVLSAAVFPEALQRTVLGDCLERVAAATHFPSQGKALAFRIPVTAKITSRPPAR